MVLSSIKKVSSDIVRGGGGAIGALKFHTYLKIWRREKHFEKKNFFRVGESFLGAKMCGSWVKNSGFQKKVVKILWA